MPKFTREQLEDQLRELNSKSEEVYEAEILQAEEAQAQKAAAIAVSREKRVDTRTSGGISKSRQLGIPAALIGKCQGTTTSRYPSEPPKPCRLQAGHGTDHFGQGNCKYHGGAGQSLNMTHGRYSTLLTDELGTLVDHFNSDPDILNLEQDIALMRALVEKWISGYDHWFLVVSAWYDDAEQGNLGSPKPRKIADITEGHVLLASLAKMVQAEYKRRQNTAVSQIHLFRIVNHIGEIISKHVTDPDTLKAIREEMLSIRFPTNITG